MVLGRILSGRFSYDSLRVSISIFSGVDISGSIYPVSYRSIEPYVGPSIYIAPGVGVIITSRIIIFGSTPPGKRASPEIGVGKCVWWTGVLLPSWYKL